MERFDSLLRNLYYKIDSPVSYCGPDKLFNYAKKIDPFIKLADIKKWLSGEITYTLHRDSRKKFKRNKYLVSGPLEQFQADLVDMRTLSRNNSNFKYILTVIDIFSKYAFAIPIKSKTGVSVSQALEKVFELRTPLKLQTDRGKEFLNKTVQDLLKKHGIHFFTTFNTKFKCAVIERFNRTLKSKMFKYFTANGTKKYVDIIDKLVDSYNKSYHKSIKTEPIKVNDENSKEIFKNIYGSNSIRDYLKSFKSKPQLKIGDKVRRKYELSFIDKSYYPNWSDELFIVKKSIKRNNRPMYSISTLNGQKIPFNLYPEEIQKITENKYRIDKIVKREMRNGIHGYIVKWKNIPEDYNSWIPVNDLQLINE